MLLDREPEERARTRLRGKAVIYAGLSVGALFLFVAQGSPWTSLGVPMSVMGRVVFSPNLVGALFFTTILQLAMALLYTWVIASLVYRLQVMAAVAAAAFISLALYGANYLIFRVLLNGVPGAEHTVLFTHLAFCMIAAGAYKGFSIPRVEPKPQEHRPA
jgi:hypothetical protein